MSIAKVDQRQRQSSAGSNSSYLMTCQEEVVNALRHRQIMSSSQLARLTGRKVSAITRAANKLVETGHVKAEDNGTYRLIYELTALDQRIIEQTRIAIEPVDRDVIWSACANMKLPLKIFFMSLNRLVRFGFLMECDGIPDKPYWQKRYRLLREKPGYSRLRPMLQILDNEEEIEAPCLLTTDSQARMVKHRRLAKSYGSSLPELTADLRRRVAEVDLFAKQPPVGLFATLLNDLRQQVIGREVLKNTSEIEMQQAELKFNLMFTHSGSGITDRTGRKYRALFERAQNEFGNGLIGLLPLIKRRGNRTSRIPSDALRIVVGIISMAIVERWSRPTAYKKLLGKCVENNISPPSPTAFGERYRKAMEATGITWQKLRIPKRGPAKNPRIAPPSIDRLDELKTSLATAYDSGRYHSPISNEDIAIAVHKFLAMLPGQQSSLGSRVLRKYRAKFAAAEQQFGNGLIGLLPRTKLRGNRKIRLAPDLLEVTNAIIEEAKLCRWSKTTAYKHLCNRCNENGLIPQSSAAFSHRFNKALPG